MKKLDITEKKRIYNLYNLLTNMSYSELLFWFKNNCSKKASIGRAAINRNLRLKRKSFIHWNSLDFKDAKKAISFLKRHKGQPSGKLVKGCSLSKRTIALMNWAYNPNKN